MAPRYSIIPGAFAEDPRPRHLHYRIINLLGRHTDDEGWCRLRQARIGAFLRNEDGTVVHRVTVNRVVRDLVEWGYLETHQAETGGRALWYRVIMDRPGGPPNRSNDGSDDYDDECSETTTSADEANVTTSGVAIRGYNKNDLYLTTKTLPNTEAQRELEVGQEAKHQRRISDNRERNIDNVFKGLDRELAMEETRARAVGLSADETKRLTIEESALLQIRLSGREPTDKEIERVRESAIARVAAARATADLSEELQLLQEHSRIAGRALENGFSGWIRGTEVSWRGMISRMLEDMAMLSARKMVFEPIFGGTSQGNTGGIVGSALTSIFGSLFGGQRETGGPVSPGLAYIVGEKRPEIFIPDRPGAIVPDVNLRAYASASEGAASNERVRGEVHVFVHSTPELDARVVSTAEGVVVRRAPEIVGRSVEAVANSRKNLGLDVY